MFLFGLLRNLAEKEKEKQDAQDRKDYWIVTHHPALVKHFDLMEMIRVQYAEAYKEGDYFGPKMNQVIQLCNEDIGLAETCRDLWQKYDHNLAALPQYPSFSRLAIIYEKRGEYQKSARVCKMAIEIGFTNDGTKGGMQGRLDKMNLKSKKAVHTPVRNKD